MNAVVRGVQLMFPGYDLTVKNTISDKIYLFVVKSKGINKGNAGNKTNPVIKPPTTWTFPSNFDIACEVDITTQTVTGGHDF